MIQSDSDLDFSEFWESSRSNQVTYSFFKDKEKTELLFTLIHHLPEADSRSGYLTIVGIDRNLLPEEAEQFKVAPDRPIPISLYQVKTSFTADHVVNLVRLAIGQSINQEENTAEEVAA